MSGIQIKSIYDADNNIIYPQTITKAVINKSNGFSLYQQLLTIDSSFNVFSENIKEINNNIENNELKNELDNLKNELDNLKNNIKNSTNEYYNIHLKKDLKENKNDIYVVIENYNSILNDPDTYRIAFMKQSKKNKEGNSWRVPMFNKYSLCNKYYYTNGELNNIGDQIINNSIIKIINIDSLPCTSLKKRIKSNRTKKLYPYYINENEIAYKEDTTYVFKNSNNKKLHIGYAIFKKIKTENNKEKWIRISNIAKIDLYAYFYKEGEKITNKYFINII